MRKHHRLDTALWSVRQDLANQLSSDAIEKACREAGHSWRNRILNPFKIVHLFLIQILLGNTSAQHVSLLAGRSFSDTAYCQARSRLPLAILRNLLIDISLRAAKDAREEGLWHGHRTFLVDGTSVSMPDTPELQSHFGQPGGQKPGCGFPVAKILAMFHAGTGLLSEIAVAPLRTHDLSQVGLIHPVLKAGDVLLGDRGFCSYLHLAMLHVRGTHAVFRVHQRQNVDFTPGRKYARPGQNGRQVKGLPRSRQVRKLGPLDQVVEWFRPESVPARQVGEDGRSVRIPARLRLRELRYAIRAKGFRTREVTLVTTLLDAEIYPASEIAELYGKRWQVEVNLRDLKQTLGMDVLKCKTVDGVLKEMHAFAIVYNLVRAVAIEAARRQGVSPERISFVDALRWLEMAEIDTELPRLVINPVRRGRFEPRVRKRRPKQYPLMEKPRRKWKEDVLNERLVA
jgi:hypothetical protein